MPWTGVYADDEHVLGHELVHVFQYNIAETAPGQGFRHVERIHAPTGTAPEQLVHQEEGELTTEVDHALLAHQHKYQKDTQPNLHYRTHWIFCR